MLATSRIPNLKLGQKINLGKSPEEIQQLIPEPRTIDLKQMAKQDQSVDGTFIDKYIGLISRYKLLMNKGRDLVGEELYYANLDDPATFARDEIERNVNKLLPVINPANKKVKVYYFAAGPHLMPVIGATNPDELVYSDAMLSRDYESCAVDRWVKPTVFTNITNQILTMDGKIHSANVEFLGLTPAQPIFIDKSYLKHIEKLFLEGLIKLNMGEAGRLCIDLSVEDKKLTLDVVAVRLSDDIYELNINGRLPILAKTRFDGNNKIVGIDFMTDNKAKAQFEYSLPPVIQGASTHKQKLTYYTGEDLNSFIPTELESGYDVLWAKEAFFLKDEKTIKELLRLMRPGGSIVFYGESNTLAELKDQYFMFEYRPEWDLRCEEYNCSVVLGKKI